MLYRVYQEDDGDAKLFSSWSEAVAYAEYVAKLKGQEVIIDGGGPETRLESGELWQSKYIVEPSGNLVHASLKQSRVIERGGFDQQVTSLPSTSIPLWPFVGAIGLLLLAIFSRWSDEFYFVLRVVVCAVAAYVARQAYIRKQVEWTGVLAIVAVLYNPLVRVHLSRDIWQLVNLLTAGLFWVAVYGIRKKLPISGKEKRTSPMVAMKANIKTSLKRFAPPIIWVIGAVSVATLFWGFAKLVGMEEIALDVLKVLGFIVLLPVGATIFMFLMFAPLAVTFEHFDLHPEPPANYIGEGIALLVSLNSFILLYLHVHSHSWITAALAYACFWSSLWLYCAWSARLKPVCSERTYAFLGWAGGAIWFILFYSLIRGYGEE